MTLPYDPADTLRKAFGLSLAQAESLGKEAHALTPSPWVRPQRPFEGPTTFEEFVKDLPEAKNYPLRAARDHADKIPAIVASLAQRAARLELSEARIRAIGKSMFEEGGLLHWIIAKKNCLDRSHPAYVRVACTGRGDYDDEAIKRLGLTEDEPVHKGDYGSPVVLELWPAGHYSTIHDHGTTTGILVGLAGEVTVVCCDKLVWEPPYTGLITLRPGQVCWLDVDHYPFHKVAAVLPPGTFGASFHVYLNRDELPIGAGKDETREVFRYVKEDEDKATHTHPICKFDTYSDLSWSILKKVIDEG